MSRCVVVSARGVEKGQAKPIQSEAASSSRKPKGGSVNSIFSVGETRREESKQRWMWRCGGTGSQPAASGGVRAGGSTGVSAAVGVEDV